MSAPLTFMPPVLKMRGPYRVYSDDLGKWVHFDVKCDHPDFPKAEKQRDIQKSVWNERAD